MTAHGRPAGRHTPRLSSLHHRYPLCSTVACPCAPPLSSIACMVSFTARPPFSVLASFRLHFPTPHGHGTCRRWALGVFGVRSIVVGPRRCECGLWRPIGVHPPAHTASLFVRVSCVQRWQRLLYHLPTSRFPTGASPCFPHASPMRGTPSERMRGLRIRCMAHPPRPALVLLLMGPTSMQRLRCVDCPHCLAWGVSTFFICVLRGPRQTLLGWSRARHSPDVPVFC